MKRKITLAVFAAIVFVSVPPVFAEVHRFALSELAGEETMMTINRASVEFTAILYAPVLLIALIFWLLTRPARPKANPPSDRRPLYPPPRTQSTTWRASAARAHFMVDHPILYLALALLDALSGEPRRDRR